VDCAFYPAFNSSSGCFLIVANTSAGLVSPTTSFLFMELSADLLKSSPILLLAFPS